MQHDRFLRWPTIAVAGAVALVVIAVASAAGFNPGDLDTSFSGDGKQNVAMSGIGGFDYAYALAIQSDGKLVLAGNANGGSTLSSDGDFGLARLNPGGSLDTSFDGDGRVTTSLAAPGGTDEAHAAAIQPSDGKIVAAGTFKASVANNDFAVVRYNTNGTPDATFGGGDGIVTTDMRDGTFTSDDNAWGVAIQPSDGKIVVVGTDGGANGAGFAVARYETDGTPDATFGGDGTVVTPFCSPCGSGDKAAAVAVGVQPADGKIVLAGVSWSKVGSYYQSDFALARYNTDGTPDNTFDGDGKLVTPVGTGSFPWDEAHALVILSSGKIVAAGSAIPGGSLENFALVKYNTDGTLDSGFGGGDGIVTTDVSPIHNTSIAYGLVVQADGKLVAAGTASDYDLGYFHKDFGIARYNTNGTLDPDFGGDGIVTTAIADDPDIDIGRAVKIQTDGKIVVAGWSDMGPPEYYDFDFSVARYAAADTKPPETIIDSAPKAYTNDSTPTFAFHSSESGSTFECKVDAGLYAACTSAKTVGPLADGPHTFYVRAKDKAGNVDPTPAYRTFTVDTAAPNTIIDTGPSGATSDNTPTFTFHSTEVNSTFACKVDGSSFSGCTSPKTLNTLGNGPHTFYVRAKDKAGNVDPTPASRSFTVQA